MQEALRTALDKASKYKLAYGNQYKNAIRTEGDLETNPVYGFYATNSDQIDSLIQPSSQPLHTFHYEDVEMSYFDFPLPFISTEHELLKRQNDVFSGNIAFSQTVSICRMFLRTIP